jgi:hypothetical protein
MCGQKLLWCEKFTAKLNTLYLVTEYVPQPEHLEVVNIQTLLI